MNIFEIHLELQESRRSDRAFAWFIPRIEHEGRSDKDLNAYFLLPRGQDKIRRGDLLYYQTQTEAEFGVAKKIFDGRRVHTLVNGRVPLEFQVAVEFPVHYWEGRLKTPVPFDFATHVNDLTVTEITFRNGLPCFEITVDDGTLYTFTSHKPLSAADFISALNVSTYFNYGSSETVLYLL